MNTAMDAVDGVDGPHVVLTGRSAAALWEVSETLCDATVDS